VASLTTSTKNVDANGNGTYTSGDFTTAAPVNLPLARLLRRRREQRRGQRCV